MFVKLRFEIIRILDGRNPIPSQRIGKKGTDTSIFILFEENSNNQIKLIFSHTGDGKVALILHFYIFISF